MKLRAGGTSALRTFSRVEKSDSPTNSRSPVSISYRSTPAANTSLRRSIGFPITCSGDMYPNLPLRMPAWVFCEPVRRLRDPEVDQLHLAVEREEDVLGRDVAVDDVQVLPARVLLPVRVVEPLADLRRHVRRLGDRHRLLRLALPLDDRAQVPARHVLHRDVVRALVLPELVDVHHVRVAQLNADPRLVDEHRDELFILRHRGEDLLDRDELLEALDPERLGDEHLRHSTDVDALEEEVLAKGRRFLHRVEGPGPEGSGRERQAHRGRRPLYGGRKGASNAQAGVMLPFFPARQAGESSGTPARSADKKEPPSSSPKRGGRGCTQEKSGSDLLSHAVSRGVPSALEGLTSVFGMGTGVTPPTLPPETFEPSSWVSSTACIRRVDGLFCSSTVKL